MTSASSSSARCASLFRSHGYSSIQDFAAEHQTKSFRELATTLGVTPIELQICYEMEARRQENPRALAQDLLFRRLLDIPNGWPAENSWNALKDIQYQITAWCELMNGTAFHASQEDIANDILDSDCIPSGWIPQSGNDKIIQSLFDRLWSPRDSHEI